MSWWNEFSEGEIVQAIRNSLDGGSSASLIHQASRTLTNAEIIAWQDPNPGYFVIVPSPGAQRCARFLEADVLVHRVSTVYTNASANSNIYFTEYGGIAASLDPNMQSTWNTLGPFDRIIALSGLDREDIIDLTAAANKPIRLDQTNSGNLEGGNAGDSLTACCTFLVFDVSTGRYLTTAESGWNETTRTFDI